MPRDLPWRKWIPWFVGIFCVLLIIALILPAIQQAREAARRSQSKNNLYQAGLALHNYHDAHQVLPPGGTFDADGRPYHGWPLAVVPFIEASPLYHFFDLEVPWDDPANRVHCSPLPIYLNPQLNTSQTSEGFGLMHYPANSSLMSPNSSVTYDDVTAGLSNVWMLSERFDNWQPWGSPYNWHELEWPVTVAGNEHGWAGGGAQLLMADGSVQFFGLEPERLKRIEEIRAANPHAAAVQIPIDIPTWTYLQRGETPSVLRKAIHIYDIDWIYDDVSPAELQHSLITRLHAQLEKMPDATILLIRQLDLDEETIALSLVMKFKQLECLRVGELKLSEEGLNQLAELKSLKILYATVDQQTANWLRQLLPDCELRLTILESEIDETTDEPAAEEPSDARE